MLQCYNILSTEIKNIKECYPHFELQIEQDATRTPVLKTTLKLETDVQYNQSIYLRSCLIKCGFQGRGRLLRPWAFVREGRLIQTCQLRGALIR